MHSHFIQRKMNYRKTEPSNWHCLGLRVLANLYIFIRENQTENQNENRRDPNVLDLEHADSIWNMQIRSNALILLRE